jgi:hypothetical protein
LLLIWEKVTLQGPSAVTRVVMDWETAHCTDYAVLVMAINIVVVMQWMHMLYHG